MCRYLFIIHFFIIIGIFLGWVWVTGRMGVVFLFMLYLIDGSFSILLDFVIEVLKILQSIV